MAEREVSASALILLKDEDEERIKNQPCLRDEASIKPLICEVHRDAHMLITERMRRSRHGSSAAHPPHHALYPCLIIHVNTFLNKLVHISEIFSEFCELPDQTI